MRIISKFQDYYDSAMAYGQDLTHVFNRADNAYDKLPENFMFLRPFDTGNYSRYSEHPRVDWSSPNFELRLINIAFCGYVHNAIRVVQTKPVKGIDPPQPNLVYFNPVVRFFYSFNELSDFMKKYDQMWFFHDSKSRFSHREAASKVAKVLLEGDPDARYYNNFVEQRLPVAVYDPVEDLYRARRESLVQSYPFVENARLSDYQFYKKFDAFAAYQELDMFVSGVMAPENKPMVAIDDNHKAYQHGFDCYSFRNGPTKKKLKVCKKP